MPCGCSAQEPGSLRALDNRTTLLAPVPRDVDFPCRQFLELIAFAAAGLETFRAKAVAQLLAGKG